MLHRGGGGGGVTLIFSYTRRLGSFSRVQNFKILNFNIFCGFSEKRIFFGYEDFMDIFKGHHNIWTIFRGHFYALKGLFLRSRYRMMDIFWGC